MIGRSWVVLLLAFPLFAIAETAEPDSPHEEGEALVRAYVDEAIATVRAHALYADKVDWAQVADTVQRNAADAHSRPAAYEAIRTLLSALGDRHSFLQLSPELAAAEAAVRGDEAGPHEPGPEVGSRAASPFSGRRNPEFAMLERPGARIAYAFMPQGRRDAMFAATFQRHLSAQHQAGACGWILDLRGNGGGNVWPMIAGLGPLLGDGEHGGSIGAGGRRFVTLYRNGAAILREPDGKETTVVEVPGPLRLDPLPPVAVLVDRSTGSSGEMVAIALHGRERTRSFGEHTYGASTSTEGFPLSDGANLVIATAVMADSSWRPFDAGYMPDVPMPTLSTRPELAQDPVAAQAAAWLEQAPACREVGPAAP